MEASVLDLSPDLFELDVQIVVDVQPGHAIAACSTNDGCAATCASSCASRA
jgi:FxLD family lantipeptide